MPEELREPVCLLDGLGAGERRHDRRPGVAEEALGLVERVGPGERFEAARPGLAERILDPVGRVQVREREAALVAEPALVDLGMVAREDPLDLALARRR